MIKESNGPDLRTATPAPELTPHWDHRAFPIWVAALSVVVGLVLVFPLPGWLGDPQWLPMGDLKWTIQSSQYVMNGGLTHVYSVNPEFLPLPGMLFLLGPAVALGQALGLVNNLPFPLAHPSMLLVAAPPALLYGTTLVPAADYLACTLGIPLTRRRIIAVAVGALVVLPTVAWAGHPEDLVAGALSCWSLALLLRRRFPTAALVLSLAIVMQTWAALLLFVFLVVMPRPARVRGFLVAALPPTVLGGLLLFSDFHDAFRSLIIQPMEDNGQHLPWWGLAHPTSIVELGATVSARVGSEPRSLAIVGAALAAWAIRRSPTSRNVMLAAAAALIARDAFETQLFDYYLGPAAVLLILLVASGTLRRPWRWAVGGGCVFVYYGFAAGSYAQTSMPAGVALAILLATAAGSVLMSSPRRPPHN